MSSVCKRWCVQARSGPQGGAAAAAHRIQCQVWRDRSPRSNRVQNRPLDQWAATGARARQEPRGRARRGAASGRRGLSPRHRPHVRVLHRSVAVGEQSDALAAQCQVGSAQVSPPLLLHASPLTARSPPRARHTPTVVLPNRRVKTSQAAVGRLHVGRSSAGWLPRLELAL